MHTFRYDRIADARKGFYMPVIHVPAFVGAGGMPIGVSLVVGRYRDRHLSSICKVIGGALMDEGG